MNEKYNILYVDDEESNLNIFKNTFRREYNVYTALSAKEGIDILTRNKIDLILTDQRMPEMDGVDFLKHALKKYPDLNRILITAYTDFDAIRDAVNEAQIFQYIQKPWKEKELQMIISEALEVYRLKKENKKLTRELKEKNKQLKEINQELIKYDKLKSEFLAIISHEIRTPLNGLHGAKYILKSKMKADSSEDFEQLFYILETSVNRLEQFALSAIHITELKSQQYKLNLEIIDLYKIISETGELLLNKLNEKNIELIYDINKLKPFHADEYLVKICIKELIDNAIKFSGENSKIYIDSYYKNGWTVLEIADHGKGFEKKVLENLYQLFITGDLFQDQKIGLDLALVKLIMDAHDGKITIENNSSGGATIRLLFKKYDDKTSIEKEKIEKLLNR